jgi:hypothetical protein
MATAVDDFGSEKFPTFQSARFQDMGFVEQLTHPGQLATANISTLAFLAQSFATGGLTAELNLGARSVNALARGKNFGAVFTELVAPNLAKTANVVNQAAMNSLLTTNESAMEGMDAKKSVTEALQNDRLKGLNTFTDAEIEAKADNSLNNVFWLNMATNAATNAFFTKLVKPMFNVAKTATRANSLGLKLMSKGEGMVESSAKEMSGFKRFLVDKGNSYGVFAKTMAEQVLSEGAEEDMQYSIQKVNDAHNTGRSFLDSAMDYAKDVAFNGLDFSDKDRAKAAGLGSLMGSGGTVISSAYNKATGKDGPAKTYRDQRASAEQELNKQYTDFAYASLVQKSPNQKGKLSQETDAAGTVKYFDEVAGSKYGKQEISADTYARTKETFGAAEDGSYNIPGKFPIENGEIIKDPVRSAKFAAAATIHSELDDLIEVEAAKGNPDKLKLELYQLEKLGDLAQTAFKSGTTDLLIQKLNSYKTLDPGQLQQAGISDPKQVEDLVDGWVKHVDKLEKNYKSTVDGIIPVVYSDSDKLLVNKFREHAAHIGNRIVNLDRLIENLDNDIAKATSESTLPPERLAAIESAFKDTQNADALFPYQTPNVDVAAEEGGIASMSVKRRQLKIAREELGGIYTKMLAPKTGFKEYKAEVEKTGTAKSYSPKSAIKKQLVLRDNFTKEDFEDYVTRKSSELSFKEKVKFAHSSFYSDAINNLTQYLTSKGPGVVSVETAKELRELLSEIVDNKVNLYPDEAAKLETLVTKFASNLALQTQVAEADFESKVEDYDIDPSPINEDAYIKSEDKLKDLQAIEVIVKNFPDLLAKVKEYESYNIFPGDPESFRQQVIDDLLVSSSNLIKASKFDGTDIDPDYTNLRDTVFNIKYLEDLLEKALKDSVEFKDSVDKIKDLIKDLKVIEAAIKANLANKDRKNKKEDEIYAQGVLDVLDSIPAANNPILPAQQANLDALRKIDLTLAGAAGIDLLNKVDRAVIEKIELELKAKAKVLLESLTVFKESSFSGVAWSTALIDLMIESPTKGFYQVYNSLLDKEKSLSSAVDISALEKFVKTYDIVGFIEDVDTFKGHTSVDTLKELVKVHMQLRSFQQASMAATAGVPYIDFLASLKEFLEKPTTAIVPSSSQIRVIRELGLFALSDHNTRNHLWDNIATLKAPAGAGKSVLIAPVLKEILKYSGDEVLTCAPHKLAGENIKNSLGSSYEAFDVESLIQNLTSLTDGISENVKLIVLDEAGALSTDQLNKVASALAQRNRLNPTSPVKMVMLYDPNQITTGIEAALETSQVTIPLDSGYAQGTEDAKLEYELGNVSRITNAVDGVYFIHNVYNISPLSTTYRSDISEIVDAQNAYKTDARVSSLTSSANKDPKTDIGGVKGVYAESANNVTSLYGKSSVANPDRSRVIIVGSQVKKDKYKKAFPEAIVLTPAEAQGITKDEVYVDIETTDNPDYSNTRTFNSHMYTALSRASTFLHVANVQSSFQVDGLIDERLKQVKEDRSIGKTNAVKIVEENIKTLSTITGDFPKIKIKPEKPEKNDEEDDGPVGDDSGKGDEGKDPNDDVPPDDTKPDDTPPIVPPGKGAVKPKPGSYKTHTLRHPNNAALSQSDNDNFDILEPGMSLIVVKDTSNKKERFVVLQQSKLDPTMFRTVAILNDSEVSDFEKSTGLKSLRLLKGTSFDRQNDIFYAPENEVLSYRELFVQPGTKPLDFQYSANAQEYFTSDVDAEGKLKSLSILDNYFKGLYNDKPEDYIQNYQDVLDNFENHTKIISFKDTADVEKMFGHLSEDNRPEPTAPYLIISGVKSNAGTTLKPQFIRLVPSVLNKNSSTETFRLDKIYEFLEVLDKFEEALKLSKLPKEYTNLANGKAMVIGKSSYYPFHSFVTKLSQAAKTGSATLSMSKNRPITDALPDVPMANIPKELIDLARQLDILVHGEVEGTKENKREGNGDAQLAMTDIGSQNLVATLPTGKQIILRTEVFKSKDVSYAQGISLLGPLKFERNDSAGETKGKSNGLPHNPVVGPKIITRLQKYQKSLEKNGHANTSRYKFTSEILKKLLPDGGTGASSTYHIAPATTEDLKLLFIQGQDSKGSYTNISEGFGLRVPMGNDTRNSHYSSNEGKTIKDVLVAGKLQSNFVKVVPTQIIVSSVEAPVGTPETKVAEEIKRNAINLFRHKLSSTDAPIASIVKGLSVAVKNEFMSSFPTADTIEEAAEMYRQISTDILYETKKAQSFLTSLQKIKDRGIGLPEVYEDLETSLEMMGVGRDTGRDFIRGSVFVKLFENVGSDFLMKISAFVRTNYSGERKSSLSPVFYTGKVINFLVENSVDSTEFIKNLNKVIEVYNEINTKHSLGVKISPIEETDITKAISKVQSTVDDIVKLSFKYGEKRKAGMVVLLDDLGALELPTPAPTTGKKEKAKTKAAPITAPTPSAPASISSVEDFARELIRLGDDADAFTDFLNAPANSAWRLKLEKLNEDPYTAAENVIDNMSRAMLSESDGTQDLGEALTDDEVEAMLARYSTPNRAGIFSWFVKNKRSTEIARILEYNKLVNSEGKKAWGLYKKGIISFARMKNGKVGSRVVRHEIFHKIFWEYLTPAEKVSALNLAREKFGDQNAKELEERLAESFETFVVSEKPSVFKTLWQKLKRLLGFSSLNLNSIEDFFNSIEGGAYANQNTVADIERSSSVIDKFDTVDQYSTVKNFILQTFSELEKDRRSGNTIISYPELVDKTFEVLEAALENPSKYFPYDSEHELNRKKVALEKVVGKNSKAVAIKMDLVKKFFGQVQTKASQIKMLNEQRRYDANAIQSKLEELLAKKESKEGTTGEEDDEIESFEEELEGLKGERFDSELNDPISKMTGAVKQRLISLKHMKAGELKFIDIDEAFSVIVEGLSGIPNSSLNEYLEALKSNFEYASKVIDPETNIRTSVGYYMFTLARKVSFGFNNNPNIRSDISFRQDVNSDGLYVVYSKDGSKVANVSLEEARNKKNSDKYGYIFKSKEESVVTTLKVLQSAGVLSTPATLDQLKDSYYLFEDLDFLKSLLASTGSLRDFKSAIALKIYDRGVYKTRYIQNKKGGGDSKHEATIKLKLDDYIAKRSPKPDEAILPGHYELFDPKLVLEINTAKGTAEQLAALNKLFTALNLNRKEALKIKNNKQVSKVFESLAYAVNAMQKDFKKTIDDFESLDDFYAHRSANNLFGDESSLMESLVDLINTHYELINTNSFMRGDGKKAYGWIESSYQTGALSSITNALLNKITRVYDTFKVQDGNLTTTDRFLKNNIFFSKNGSKILKFIDHDSIKTQGNTLGAKTLTKENANHFDERHFVFGFLNRLKESSRSPVKSYYQFLPIPSNRTTIQAVDVTWLDNNKADAAIKKIIEAQQDRPRDADVMAVATYAKNVDA